MADFIWDRDAIEHLKRLWDDKASAAEIAAELGGGVTRNAVLGKLNRLGLVGLRKRPKKPKRERPAQFLLKAPARPVTAKAPRPSKAPVIASDTSPILKRPPMFAQSLNVPLVELRDFSIEQPNQCRYIAHEPPGPGYLCCANETRPGASYCPHHHEITHRYQSEASPVKQQARAA